MANPYTITVTFDVEDVNNTPDTYQLILVFTVDIEGSTRAETNKEKNLEITDHGTLEWQFEIEDGLLTPGEMTLQISDPDQYIYGLLFGTTAEQEGTRKQFQVEVLINGSTDFIGLVVEDEIEFDHAEFLLDFTATPEIDVINKAQMHNDDGLPLDPLGYSTANALAITAAVTRPSSNEDEVEITHATNSSLLTGSPCIITGVVGMTDLNRAFVIEEKVSNTISRVKLLTDQIYLSGGSIKESLFTNEHSLPVIIEDIFQLVNGGITIVSGNLDLSGCKWEMNTNTNNSTILGALADTPIVGRVRVTVITSANFSVGDPLYIKQVVGMTDLNDEFTIDAISDGTHFDVVLATGQTYVSGGRAIEIDNPIAIWGSNTIFVNGRTYFDENALPNHGLQHLGDMLREIARDWFCWAGMITQEKAFFKRLYEYDGSNKQTLINAIETHTRFGVGLLDYVKVKSLNPPGDRFFDAGVVTNLEHRALNIDDVVPAFWRVIGSFGFTNIKQSTVFVVEAKDPQFDDTSTGWKPHGGLLADLYQDARSNMNKNRTVTFLATGVGYDILKSVDHEGEGFWTIGLKKMF